MMGWPDWSDHVITPGSVLDTLGSAAQKAIGRNLQGTNYSDINRSDQDMVELPSSFVAQLKGSNHTGPWTYVPTQSPLSLSLARALQPFTFAVI
jgi:hypothetical protein